MSVTARPGARSDVPSTPWMLGMSSWMLLTLIPAAATAWIGFGIVGTMARKPRIVILAVAAGALALIAALPMWGEWQPVVQSLVYLLGILVALGVNQVWLRAMWERRAAAEPETARATAARRTAPSGAAAPARTPSARAQRRAQAQREARKTKASAAKAAKATAAKAESKAEPKVRDEPARRVDSREAAELADRVGASSADLIAPGSAPTRASEAAADPVDVNTADAAALATLPGISSARARKIVRARSDRGGFSSLDEAADVIGLQPHELVRLRGAAVCSPKPRGERRFGRRVDL